MRGFANSFSAANKKRSKRIVVGGIEYASMIKASIAIGKSHSYISVRLRNGFDTTDDGLKIERIKKVATA